MNSFSLKFRTFEATNFCTCDLTENSCDVNCCCDEDCSINDVKAFSRCKDVTLHSFSPRFCFSNEIYVENNTQYIVEKANDDGLFCIIDTNFEEAFTYLDRPAAITNVTYFEHMKVRHGAFVWPSVTFALNEKKTNAKPAQNNSREAYKSGDPIFTLHNEQELGYLSLPTKSLFGKKCSNFSPIKFMHRGYHECQIHLEQDTDCTSIPELNAINYVSDLVVITRKDWIDTNETLDRAQGDIIGNFTVKPEPEVCIVLDTDDRVCVDLTLNEALSETTKVLNQILIESISIQSEFLSNFIEL